MIINEKFPSRLEAIPEISVKLLGKIKDLLRREEAFDVKLSLEEALVNAVKHGNKLDPKLFVEVTLEVIPGSLSISVRDSGKGFDFKNIPDPTCDENVHNPNGRGIFLIRKHMDKVEYSDCGRCIKMIKFLK